MSLTCANGHETTRGLYEHDGMWLCFSCLPEEFFFDGQGKERYPGFREREAAAVELSHKRSEQARLNFGLEAE